MRFLNFYFRKISKRKLILPIFSFLFLIVGLLAALILVKRKQLPEKKAAQKTAALSFGITEFKNLKQRDPVDTNIILNPGGQEVVAVDIVIDFSKEILELTSVEPTATSSGSFKTFTPIVSEKDCGFAPNIEEANQKGRIAFSTLTFDCEAPEVTRTAVRQIVNPLAWLHFKIKRKAPSDSSATISFYYNPEDSTKDCNVMLNPLSGVIEDILLAPTSKVSISLAVEPTPTLTPSPSPTASLTPVPTLLPKPTVKPTPSPMSPMPQLSPSPTSSPSATLNPSPLPTSS